MPTKEQSTGFDPQEILEIFRKQTNVTDRVDLQLDDTMEVWRKLKPLADLAADNESLSVQEHAMLIGLGESTDGFARGIASDQGLTLEERFYFEGAEHIRTLYWDRTTPETVKIYSIKRHSGLVDIPRFVYIPLDGDMNKLSFRME